MKRLFSVLVIVSLSAALVSAQELSDQQQRDLILGYMFATGQISQSNAAAQGLATAVTANEVPVKCGTSVVLDFLLNRDKLDPGLMKSLGVQIVDRPTGLDDSLVSPSGRFLIHYTTTGENAVYSLIPGYVDSVAAIYDQVYNHLITTLGFPAPPKDGFYPGSGDDKFDVYLLNLPSTYYGLTYLDSARIDGPGTTRATAFQELDNDYQSIAPYKNRPLDAVRVTCAHEFFHVVQFGIDFTETEQGTNNGINGPAWMEMSAVWSEEENYTNINDYYYYLPYFFEAPWQSIQSFTSASSIFPYGAGVFPMFLAQEYGKAIIRDTWLKCGQVPGPNTWTSIDAVLDSLSAGAVGFASAFREFAIWNYFVGSRAALAPAGVGYAERLYYLNGYVIPDDSIMAVWTSYPCGASGDVPAAGYQPNPFNPDANAAFYMRFEELPNLVYDTTYWNCLTGTFPNCTDSAKVTDTTLGYDFLHVDSLFKVRFTLDTSFVQYWGLSIVYQLNQFPDSMIVERYTLPNNKPRGDSVAFLDPHQYRSITMIFTPGTPNRSAYRPLSPIGNYFVAYQVNERTTIDSGFINVPAGIFEPYPNPAVVSKLPEEKVTFRFQIPTDSTSYPIYGGGSADAPYLVIDLYTIAGEHIRTLDQISDADQRYGRYFSDWDLRNDAGKPVASGVYLAYARLFSTQHKGVLLAEKKTKVALIR